MTPHRVTLVRHAVERAHEHGWTTTDVAELVLRHHPQRRRNSGRAQWRIVVGAVTVLYDWPDGDDDGTARVVTLWSRD